MANTHSEELGTHDPFEEQIHWRAGAISGFIAAMGTAIGIWLLNEPTLRAAIAGLYGLEGNLMAGSLFHLVHGTLFGVVFSAVLADPVLTKVSASRTRTLLAGLVFGLVLAVFGAGMIMPIWLGWLGVATLSVPYLTGAIIAWHLGYGAVLGLLYPLLETR